MIEQVQTILEISTPQKPMNLSKGQIYEHGDFSSRQKKLFIEAVDKMTVVAGIGPRTMNIPAFEDEYVRYHQIPIIAVELRDTSKAEEVAKRIQRATSHPTVLFLGGSSAFLKISLATKRINQADSSRLTIEHEYTSDWLGIDDPLIKSFSLNENNLIDTQTLYFSFCHKIVNQLVFKKLGKPASDSLSLDEKREAFTLLIKTEKERVALTNKAKRERQSQKQIDLNKQIQKCIIEINRISQTLIGRIH